MRSLLTFDRRTHIPIQLPSPRPPASVYEGPALLNRLCPASNSHPKECRAHHTQEIPRCEARHLPLRDTPQVHPYLPSHEPDRELRASLRHPPDRRDHSINANRRISEEKRRHKDTNTVEAEETQLEIR